MSDDSAVLPPALQRWLGRIISPTARTVDCSWQHAQSQVYRIYDAEGIAYLKCFHQQNKFEQELYFYQHCAPQVSATPSLVAVHEAQPQALLLSACPGVLLQDAELNTGQRRAAFEAAGTWLRSLHDLSCADNDALSLDRAWQRRADAWMKRAGIHCAAADIEWAAQQCQSLALLQGEQRVYCHRDFSPRNLLWDHGHLSVIDFEMSRPDWWLADGERLLSSCMQDDRSLAAAFFAGYGRHPTAQQWQALFACSVLAAVATIAWSIEHRDQVFEDDGRRRLRALRQAGPDFYAGFPGAG